MDFIRYSLPAWWALALGAIVALIIPVAIPAVKPALAYAMGILLAGFGLLGMWAFWREWKERERKRNTYTIEPFKKRLARYHKRRQFTQGRS